MLVTLATAVDVFKQESCGEMWPKKKGTANSQGGITLTGVTRAGDSTELTVHVNPPAEGSDVATTTEACILTMELPELEVEGSDEATASDGAETGTAATMEESRDNSTEPEQKSESDPQDQRRTPPPPPAPWKPLGAIGDSIEVTVHVNPHAEGSDVATAADSAETGTVATVEQSGTDHSTEPEEKSKSKRQSERRTPPPSPWKPPGGDSAEITVHVNPHAEGSDVAAAADASTETGTATALAESGADSTEPKQKSKSRPQSERHTPPPPPAPLHNGPEINLPSSRRMSFRRSKRYRRTVRASDGCTDPQVVVHRSSDDPEDPTVEQSNVTSKEEEEEEEQGEDNELLSLQDRLLKQREKGQTKQIGRVSKWKYFVYVQWPKIKKRAVGILSFKNLELWRSDMKYILGTYGSGAYSYYNFLRWLFLINLLFAVLLISFIIIPQFVWRATEAGRAESNRRSIARTYCLRAAANCTVCQGCDPAIIINSPNSASNSNSTNNTVFTVTECTVGVASIGLQRDVITGNFSQPEWFLCFRDECPRNILGCFDNFLSGEGLFADSELFLGWYTSSPIRWPTISAAYDMPMAYLLTAATVYALSLILVIIRIGASFQEQYTHRNEKAGKHRNLCNNFFTGWDFNITQKQLAESRHKAVKTKLQELSFDVMERGKDRTRFKTLLVILIRIVTNTFVFVSLIAGGVAIFYSVRAEIQQFDNTSYLSTAVITLINLIYPLIYGLLIKAEMYQKSRHALFMTLLRLWTLRFYSYFSLLIAVTSEIQCTQPPSDQTGGQCSLSVSLQDLAGSVASSSSDVCPSCWETVLGQKFYANAIVNLAVSLIMTFGLDTLSNITSRCKCKLPEFLTLSREFGVPEGIIDLIEIQIIFWLGFFFAPMICITTTLNLFLLFYVKRYSMQLNLTPSKELYLAARKDLTYLLLLLGTGLLCLLPVGYTIANLVPSSTCGPFRELGFFYNIMDTRINELMCIEQKLVTTFLSAGFLAPLFLFLVMLIIGLAMVLRAKGTSVQLLVKQLKLESDDKDYLYNLMRAQGIGSDVDSDEEVDAAPAEDQTDNPSGKSTPTSPKMSYPAATLLARSPIPSQSSLQLQAGDTGTYTLSRARHMRMSQESTALGRAIMQLNPDAKKDSTLGRKSPNPDRRSSSLSVDDFSGTLRARAASNGARRSTKESIEEEDMH